LITRSNDLFFCTLVTGCGVPGWTTRVDQTALGAEDYVTRGSVQGCLNYCSGKRDCAGVDVDYNLNPKRCWPHTSYANFLSDNIFRQPGTNSYQLVSVCATELTTTGTPILLTLTCVIW